MNARRPLPHDPAKVRVELQRRLADLLPKLGIDDRLRGRVLITKNPRRPENTRKGNFAIWLEGDGAGSFKDYGTGGQVRGDVYDLIRYLARLNEWIDAYWWALDFLNLSRHEVRSIEQAKVDEREAEAERQAREAKRAAEERRRSRNLFGWWLRLPPITGTVVETYLREARGIPLEKIGSPKYRLGALRFADRLEHVDDETGEVTVWPAMVAAMTNGPGVVGLHRTWLRPDGRGKADVKQPKKMIGPCRGAAIRLTTGPSGLSPARAAQRGELGPLAIGEGIETCLSLAAAAPQWRVWAAGSISHMALLAWPDCASGVILVRDNDWKRQARDAFEGAVLHWKRQARGRPVDVFASQAGNDFNDWLKGAA